MSAMARVSDLRPVQLWMCLDSQANSSSSAFAPLKSAALDEPVIDLGDSAFSSQMGRTPAYLVLPLPVSFTDCGSPCALSMIIKVAFCAPVPLGVNVTSIVHFAFGASGASQPLATL